MSQEFRFYIFPHGFYAIACSFQQIIVEFFEFFFWTNKTIFLKTKNETFDHICLILIKVVPLGSLHKLRLHFLAFDHLRNPPSLHFLCVFTEI